MAASKLKLPDPPPKAKGIDAAMEQDHVAAAAGKKGGWGFVQFFFVLSVVLCVLLYAPRVFVLDRYGGGIIDIASSAFTAPADSSSSQPQRTSSSSSGVQPQQPHHHVVAGNASDDAGGDKNNHGRRRRRPAAAVLDNQVHSPCSSMRDHTICCDRSSVHTDVCFMAGDVRTDAATLSLLLYQKKSPNATSSSEERVRPYPRKWEDYIMRKVPEVRLRPVEEDEEAAAARRCDVRHEDPLLVMSAGGYTGNLFHAFNDGFLPTWITAQHLRRRVVLGVLSYNPWWAGMFSEVIAGLSDHPVVDLLHDTRTHCFPGAIVGTRFHGILIVDPDRLRDGKTVVDFHQMLADAYEGHLKGSRRRRRRRDDNNAQGWGTRVIENQAAVARLATSVGFDVEVLDTAAGLPLSAWYASLSACDALVGVHGADLTKFLFLRPAGRASLVQIAPLGVSPIARECFAAPSQRMGVVYEQYEVGAAESSLALRYAPGDAVLADPEAAKRAGGWPFVSRVYLGGQNVSLDLGRFRETLGRLHAHALRQR
ncbi:hypothetical protein U9M48_016453 [Paspalum notatum var. saurae]|uniref:Glycosyltransferase n=1 Tax=Paspalum notatum var. saurae TaxID=547442 RepID=A0AAQ3T6E8_PASNO